MAVLPETAHAVAEGHIFNPEILREYDIRGRVGESLSVADAYAVGRAFATLVKRRGGSQICVGYDGRETSPEFAQAVIQGIVDTGLIAENVGRGPSPMLYFAVKDHMADGGIMVTGSHNPAEYNGFKMTLQTTPVFGALIQELGQISANGDFESGEGSVRDVDVTGHYIERLLRDFDGAPDTIKIAWDCGNGATGDIIRALTARLPGEHILLYDEIDGNFPNHHPDPTVDENLQDLIKTVTEQHCDFGIAFDGDGDRIGVVDEQGRIVRCDTLLAIYAREVLEERRGAPIIADIKCSQVLFDEIERLGGQAIMWKTGHSLIKDKMAQTRAPLAGELSGHIFFADKWYGFDDATYCAIRLMNEVYAEDGPLSRLTAHLPQLFNTPEIRVEVEESKKFALVDTLAETIKQHYSDGYNISEIDGIRVSCDKGWWLIRASNTQNMLVVRVEANSAEALDDLKTMVQNEIRKTGHDIIFS